jgi:hypothetical protein
MGGTVDKLVSGKFLVIKVLFNLFAQIKEASS